MRARWPLLLGLSLLAAIPRAGVNAYREPLPPPSLPPLSEEGLPPLPPQSPRNASYTITARLDPDRHTIDGTLLLDWRNTTGQPQTTFPFHLYWNAFRNNLSSSARGEGRRAARVYRGKEERGFGFIDVRSVHIAQGGLGGPYPPSIESGAGFIPAPRKDLTSGIRYVQPDDGNADDRTLMEVTAPFPVADGATVRFEVSWHARVPYGDVGRSGWVHDYHFIAQWFPKIAGWWKGAWNAHQFHAWPEFFSDFGVYDVRLTVPQGFVLGATGRESEPPRDDPDGTRTFHYQQPDVHDFTWVTSRRLVERRGQFADAGYPPVEIRLLVQPEHEHLSERYLEATRIALRTYGAWSAPYPYPNITVVDPAWNSASGGMEYPTLFTGGASVLAPRELQSPEGVTIHEAGHQFWYGLVANNEFEEAWLDEGFNSYHDEKAAQLFLGPLGWGRRYFGPLTTGRGSRAGWPVVAPGVRIFRGESDLSGLRRSGETDAMARRGWEYRTRDAYGLNSYGKPALSLQTLEGLVGEETMTRILRTYARRFRFAHPTSDDFIAVVGEVTGQDWRWYFDQTWFSSSLCDYAISATNAPPRTLQGWREGPDGRPAFVGRPAEGDRNQGEGPWESEVVVQRLGEVRLPVEIRVQFSDGRVLNDTWDGQYRWKRLRFPGPAKVVAASVDPGRKIALDIDPSNNHWADAAEPQARRAATKWTLRWMFWLQNLLELHMLLA